MHHATTTQVSDQLKCSVEAHKPLLRSGGAAYAQTLLESLNTPHERFKLYWMLNWLGELAE